MVSFKTHPGIIGKFIWIWKITYNVIKEGLANILIVFHDMIVDMLSNKNFNPIVTELFIRQIKLNIYLVSITQSYCATPKLLD